jgi:WD40 repeat protein
VALGDRDGNVNLWDTETGKHLALLRIPPFAEGLAFSPSGRMAIACTDGLVRLWRAGAPHEDFKLQGHDGGVSSVAFSADGKLLASASHDRTVRVWDMNALMTREVFWAHGVRVWCVAFSPDGRVLATGGENGLVKLHPLLLPSAEHLHGEVFASPIFRLSPDGRSLATLSQKSPGEPGLLQLWDRRSGRWRALPSPGPAHFGPHLAFSPDGRTLAVLSPSGITLCDTASGKRLGEPVAGRFPSFLPDGQVLITGTPEGEIRLWDVATQAPRRCFAERPPNLCALACSPDGSTLASGHDNGQVWLWDVATGRRWDGAPVPHRSAVEVLCFSPDGKFLAVASRSEATVHFWDVRDRRPLSPLAGQFSGVAGLAFSPDGRTLAVASFSRVFLFHVLTRQELFALEKHPTCTPSVQFTPDGQALITGIAPAPQAGKEVYELITWHAPRVEQVGRSSRGRDP